MKAMVLAAGVGNRLKPLTNDRPKALIEINGVPMLEIVIKRLMKAGVDQIVINVFHLAESIIDFLRTKDNYGIHIEISREKTLLDTGGGLKEAGYFFDDERPFFLHNVDVFTDLNLDLIYRRHQEQNALATLAVSARNTDRCLLFDESGALRGWENVKESKREWAGPPLETPVRMAFNGIHVISPKIFKLMTETNVFSITKTYLRLAGVGEKIQAFRMDPYYWKDIGSAEKLEEVRRYAKEKGLPS